MSGSKENIVSMGITIQDTPGVFNPPNQTTDLLAASSIENGVEAIESEDDLETGSIWSSPMQFISSTSSASATFRMRGPGNVAIPAANELVIGRLLQAAGFTEIINPSPITGTARANAEANKIILEAGESSIDDFYKGFPIQHANAGTGIRGTTLIRSYDGATQTAELMETLGSAIGSGEYTIPAGLFYLLSEAQSVPLISASIWRHKKRYNLKDCAISSFAINIPTNNRQNTEFPAIEFALTGIPAGNEDQLAPSLPDSLVTSIPPARNGKFVMNGIKRGSQSLRIEFGLETGAPPNMNFDEGEESQQLLSGERTISLDVNQEAMADFDIDALVDARLPVPIFSLHGLGPGNTFYTSIPNAYLKPFSPTGRNGFVGLSGNSSPTDILRSIGFGLLF